MVNTKRVVLSVPLRVQLTCRPAGLWWSCPCWSVWPPSSSPFWDSSAPRSAEPRSTPKTRWPWPEESCSSCPVCDVVTWSYSSLWPVSHSLCLLSPPQVSSLWSQRPGTPPESSTTSTTRCTEESGQSLRRRLHSKMCVCHFLPLTLSVTLQVRAGYWSVSGLGGVLSGHTGRVSALLLLQEDVLHRRCCTVHDQHLTQINDFIFLNQDLNINIRRDWSVTFCPAGSLRTTCPLRVEDRRSTERLRPQTAAAPKLTSKPLQHFLSDVTAKRWARPRHDPIQHDVAGFERILWTCFLCESKMKCLVLGVLLWRALVFWSLRESFCSVDVAEISSLQKISTPSGSFHLRSLILKML